jgi:large subunit ribosomal protein L32
MAVQKRRQSSARRDSRRAQWMASVKKPNVNHCPKCSAPKQAHRVCMSCGFYKDQAVVEVKQKDETEGQ